MIVKTSKKKKFSVAIVVPTFIPETYGGAEQQALKLAISLKNYNIDPFILAPKIKKKYPFRKFRKKHSSKKI